MSIDFATLQGLTIPEGVVTQITDAAGNVLWSADAGFDGTFKVKKITATTYAGEVSNGIESFVLLDVYPKTGGTVSVTYEGVTKTITDTSGAAEPNSQQVFFGKFNGVADEVETPSSGIVKITGACRGFAVGTYKSSSKGATSYCGCITGIGDISMFEKIQKFAFRACSEIKKANISEGVKSIEAGAFYGCSGLTDVFIPKSIETISNDEDATYQPWVSTVENNPIKVDSNNPYFYVQNNCLIETATNRVVCGFSDSIIPDGVTRIGASAFYGNYNLESLTIPANITSIGGYAFYSCNKLKTVIMLSTTPPSVLQNYPPFGNPKDATYTGSLERIIVPAGCGDAYKAADTWGNYYADFIVEAS